MPTNQGIIAGDDPGPEKPKAGVKKGGVPRGFHRDKEGNIVRNTGERRGLEVDPETGLAVGQGEVGAGQEGDGGQGGQEGGFDISELPESFLKRLAKAGLTVNHQGEITEKRKKGESRAGHGAGFNDDPRRLALMQEGFNRFGLTNSDFNTDIVYFSGEMQRGPLGPAGTFIDLATGLDQFGGTYTDEELALARQRSGFDIQNAIDWYTKANTFNVNGEPYTSYAYQDPERLTAYFEAVRASAMTGGRAYFDALTNETVFLKEGEELPPNPTTIPPELLAQGEQTPATPPGPSYLGGFDNPLEGIISTAQAMLKSQQAKQQAESVYGPYYGETALTGEE